MSQRAAWQLERYGFTHVHDFVCGKAHWLASGRPTVRQQPIDRVLDHLTTDVVTIDVNSTVAQAIAVASSEDSRLVVIGVDRVVLGAISADRLRDEDADAVVAEVMSLGPTTIRPDELADGVRKRMTSRNVRSMLVTTPKGELLGRFEAK